MTWSSLIAFTSENVNGEETLQFSNCFLEWIGKNVVCFRRVGCKLKLYINETLTVFLLILKRIVSNICFKRDFYVYVSEAKVVI